jgi:deoxyhypusine synthase
MDLSKLKPIKHIKTKKAMTANELVKGMKEIGFNAKYIGQAADILETVIKNKQCKLFFGLAGALVPGGLKEIFIEMLEKGYVDVFVTTGANLTHDLIEALGFPHYQGTAHIDDEKLNEEKIDRIYNVFMKDEVYDATEDFFVRNFDSLSKKTNVKEFLWELGRLLPGRSILKICYEKKIPIFCPAITDSGIGMMVWSSLLRKEHKNKKINLNEFDDLADICDIVWDTKKRGILYVGGGTPKNYIQQALQFVNGADYGVQITTDKADPGGSSGAPLREGISWGKMDKKAKFVTVNCDATIALPLLIAALRDRIK